MRIRCESYIHFDLRNKAFCSIWVYLGALIWTNYVRISFARRTYWPAQGSRTVMMETGGQVFFLQRTWKIVNTTRRGRLASRIVVHVFWKGWHEISTIMWTWRCPYNVTIGFRAQAGTRRSTSSELIRTSRIRQSLVPQYFYSRSGQQATWPLAYSSL